MSRAESLFKLGLEITRKHESAPPDQITVVPVIVDDLEAAAPILGALCTIHEGRFLTTVGEALHSPVPGSLDALRRNSIATALTGKPKTGRHVDLEDRADGMLDAVFAEPPSVLPSQGEQEILAVARAIVHREIDDRPFAVIAYREHLIDLTFQKAVWALAVDELRGKPHRKLTLVFVAENSIDIERHCQFGRGFQLAIDGMRLLRRNVDDDLRSAAAELGSKKDAIVLFLGAGFSASSHLPVGNTLRDGAIRRILAIGPNVPIESFELAKRFHAWLSSGHKDWLSYLEKEQTPEEFVRRLSLEQVVRVEKRIYPKVPTLLEFRELQDRMVKEPGPAVGSLNQILELRLGRIILAEVNFDSLIEENTTVPLEVFALEQDFERAPTYLKRYLAGDEKKVPLLKLHGTISDIESCVASTEQTELGVGQKKLEALKSMLTESPPRVCVYVGASMRDWDLRPLLLGEEFARGLDERWVTPFLNEGLEDFAMHRDAWWRKKPDHRSLQARLITETADSFLAEFAKACKTS